MSIDRRSLIKVTAGVAAAGAMAVYAGEKQTAEAAVAKSRSLYGKSKGKRVVVAGGGWGGLAAARAVKTHNPAAEVIVVEKNSVFTSCPMSNLYLGGLMPLYMSDYSALGRMGIEVRNDVITAIDPAGKKIITAEGEIDYNFLILSPGIDYMMETVKGLAEAKSHISIAWKPAAEHIMLKKQLENFEGGTMVVGIPKGPIRCPPGPYERVAMLAHHVKKNKIKGKIVVLDANEQPMSKGPGFLGAYKDLYPDIVEYHTSHEVEAVDHVKKVVKHSFGDINYDMANIIPQMKAGELVRMAGVGERWADVHAQDFRSKKHDNIYVVGDSIGGHPFPKSGYTAVSIGKACGEQLALRMSGKPLMVPSISNTCYSSVDGNGDVGKAISVTHAFEFLADKKEWKAAMTVDLKPSEAIAQAGREWADGIWFDLLGDAT